MAQRHEEGRQGSHPPRTNPRHGHALHIQGTHTHTQHHGCQSRMRTLVSLGGWPRYLSSTMRLSLSDHLSGARLDTKLTATEGKLPFKSIAVVSVSCTHT